MSQVINYAKSLFSDSIDGSWDILKDGNSLVSFKSFISFSEEGTARTLQQSIEESGFITTNKVKEAYKFKVKLALEGMEYELSRVLSILEKELNAASILQIVTPYGIMPPSTLVFKKVVRETKDGIGIIVVELSFTEIQMITPLNDSISNLTNNKVTRVDDISPIVFGKQSVRNISSKIIDILNIN